MSKTDWMTQMRDSITAIHVAVDEGKILVDQLQHSLIGAWSLLDGESIHTSLQKGMVEVYIQIDGNRMKPRVMVAKAHSEGFMDWNVAKPWGEWDRETKVVALEGVPELIKQVSAIIDRKASRALNATANMREALRKLGN